MTNHPNLDAAHAGYAAFGTGDMAGVGELLADDIVWHSAGDNVLSGDYVGKDAVFAMFGELMQETGGSFKNDIHDLLANDEHGVALVSFTATRGGKTLVGRTVHVFHMSDGKMTEFWSYPDDPGAFDEFWG
jgi:hypothetical protein